MNSEITSVEVDKPVSSRRNWLRPSHPPFQKKFMMFTFAIGAVTTLTTFVTLQLALTIFATNTSQIRSMNWEQMEQMQDRQIRMLWWMMVIIAVVNLSVSALISFIFSNRISGLMSRLKKGLDAFADGQPVSPIHPREGDFFTEVVDSANRLFSRRSAKSESAGD